MLTLFLRGGAERFALPASAVAEVVPAVPLHPAAADSPLAGLLRYRGGVVPVLALGTAGGPKLSGRIVVVEFPGDPPRRLGLLADSVSDLKPLLVTGAAYAGTESLELGTLVAVADGLVRMLDPATLLASLDARPTPIGATA